MKNISGFSRIAVVVITVLGLLALLIVGACKVNEETDGSTDLSRRQLEKSVGYTVSTVVKLTDGVFGGAVAIVGSAPGSLESTGDIIGTLNSTSYNPNTGWWSFSITLEDGQVAEVNVRFLDSSGNFHKYFSISTNRIETTGEGVGSNASFDWDFEITGVGLGSTSYVVNGGGTAKYGITSCTYSIDNMKIKKSGDGIPDSGSLTVSAGGVTFTVTFNGTESVQVTYSYLGMSYTITINLKTGTVT